VTQSRKNWGSIGVLIAMVSGVGFASGAAGQIIPQLDLNQFRPSELTTDGFAVSNADGQGHLRFGVQLYIDFARDPLELSVTNGPIPDQRLELVHSQLTGHLMWSLGLWERLVVFMDLPYTFMLNDNLSNEQAGFLDSIGQGLLIPAGRGLGDLYVGARGVLYGTREKVFQLAAQATLTANTASAAWPEQNYLGEPDRSPHIGGWFEAFATFNAGEYIRIPLNVGYKTAFTQDVPSLGIGNQFTFGGAVQLLLGQDRFMLTVESFGRTAAASETGLGGRQESPIELLGGFKYLHRKGFALGIAGTGGVTSSYGNPDWRLIGMLGYTMPEREEVVVLDADGDGIVDERDACPNDPEDFDGFQDEDGCPDLDNDADGILDVDDACPNEPGPPESDGCPDPDRDGDGVPDRIDNCPDEPGPVENQGCPEKQHVVIEESRLEILDKVYFNLNSAELQRRSYAVLDNVAEVLNAHPEIRIIRVEGHTDSTGPAAYNMRLSQRRAESVVRYMVDQGQVSEERFVAEGFGETQPLVPNAKTKMALARNRRVEFQIAEAGPEGQGDQPGEP
jgi:outer membrane protein OmpA-like peptidoglycan-associated protein